MDGKTISQFLLCCVCEMPFVDPVTAEDGQRGCRSCLERTGGTLKPIQELIVIEMLNALYVRCLQCEEENIKRGDLKQHEQISCQLALVHCKAVDIKCPWRGARQQLPNHTLECKFEQLRPALQEMITESKQLRERIQKLELLVNQSREIQQ
jgi:hypothetical protein